MRHTATYLSSRHLPLLHTATHPTLQLTHPHVGIHVSSCAAAAAAAAGNCTDTSLVLLFTHTARLSPIAAPAPGP